VHGALSAGSANALGPAPRGDDCGFDAAARYWSSKNITFVRAVQFDTIAVFRQLKGSSGLTTMPDYRAYIMGPDGLIQNRVDVQCNDDAEAIRLARQLVDGHDVELWQFDRYIETLRHSGQFSPPD
jgi:hypothetical protein